MVLASTCTSSLLLLRRCSPAVVVVRGRRREVAMAVHGVHPPPCVRGMTEWKPELFTTTTLIPCLRVDQNHVNQVRGPLAKLSLRMAGLRPVQECPDIPARRLVLLNPSLVSMFGDLAREEAVAAALATLNITREDFTVRTFPLTMANWVPADLIRAVLPEGEEAVSGFSIIGHIIHLNLKQHLEPYRFVIGEALLLTKQIRTVVNKTSTIDNTYRNFAMELLAGEKDFQVTVKENGQTFEFDFSQVYWNPRLSSEHARVVARLGPKSILYDACAGVGPFAVPAAVKGAEVHANDLNPASHRWLDANLARANRRARRAARCYNMDAREFVRSRVREGLAGVWREVGEDVEDVKEVHVTMNLPALAITFLGVFRGLFKEEQEGQEGQRVAAGRALPRVHVYGFSSKEDTVRDIQARVEHYLGAPLDEEHLEEVAFVRNVAPNKDMLRASFLVPRHVLFDMEPVKDDEVEEWVDEEEVKEEVKKRDLSPESSKASDAKKVAPSEPVWFGERL